MRLLSLEVENYRNIASASLTPGRELTVICGNNGQGKTNLLEAIWLLTGGKSFRGGKDAELVRRGIKPDVISVDPPRKGMAEEVIGHIASMEPKKIVYVSCDPATLARDLKQFTAEDYNIEAVTPVDMFPGTAHVETVVLMSKVNPNK